MSDLPILDPKEHAALEWLANKPLTNDEAQLLRREAVLIAAFEDWLAVKHRLNAEERQAVRTSVGDSR